MRTKKELHRLVDELPRNEIAAAGRYLEYLSSLGDPFLRHLLNTPEDNKALSKETAEALDEATQQAERGQGRPWEAVCKELVDGLVPVRGASSSRRVRRETSKDCR